MTTDREAGNMIERVTRAAVPRLVKEQRKLGDFVLGFALVKNQDGKFHVANSGLETIAAFTREADGWTLLDRLRIAYWRGYEIGRSWRPARATMTFAEHQEATLKFFEEQGINVDELRRYL